MNLRILGVLLLLAAAACMYLGVWQPLQQARAGVESITLYGGFKLAFLVPACILFGLGYLVGGGRFHLAVQNHDPDKIRRWGKTSGIGWLLMLTSLGGAFALYEWVQSALVGFGYGRA